MDGDDGPLPSSPTNHHRSVQAADESSMPQRTNLRSQQTAPATAGLMLPPRTDRDTSRLDPMTDTPDSLASDRTTRSSGRPVSWTAMFDNLLNGHIDKDKDVLDKCSITYLGESFPLALVLDDFRDGRSAQVHHRGLPVEAEAIEERVSDDSSLHPAHIPEEDIQFLRAKGAFTPPTTAGLDILIQAFMDRVYPLYPIVDPQEFLMQHKTNTLPWIILHSVCYITATFCTDATLSAAGYSDRKAARISFQTKAKALFDIGYDSNKVVLLQSALMLSFWGGGPNTFWNFYSWLSAGVTIAETLGMHRSFARTNMKPQDKSLLKRLWWTLVLRDSACSAFIGRPFRIDMSQCDTEPLTQEDFLQLPYDDPAQRRPWEGLYGRYHVHTARLSLIIRYICTARFKSSVQSITSDELCQQLLGWHNELPKDLVWGACAQSDNIFSATLSIAYNHYHILSYLGESARPSSQSGHTLPNTAMAPAETSHNSAQHILGLASTIARKDGLLSLPHEAFHGLFMAEAVCYTRTRHTNPLISQLGYASLNNCQLLFHSIRDAFDASPWVVQLFDTLLSYKRIETQVEQQPPPGPDPAAAAFFGSLGPGWSTDTQVLQEHDLWMSNPMLSTIFDIPWTDNGTDTMDMNLFPATGEGDFNGGPGTG
ncbi:Fungal specific transcription factor domain-containing protein 50 [Elsinoe fawcettii]|nr:Fungal specific transcription factor domain-containing protein 50 [Elsinoe fawcettii]